MSVSLNFRKCFVKPMSKSSKDCSDKYEYDTTVIPVAHDFRVLSQDIVSDRNAPHNSPALNKSSSQTSKRGWAQETMNNRRCYITLKLCSTSLNCVCTGVRHV